MHNTTSNANSATDWANRFVPLPPTEFPPEKPVLGRNEAVATSGGGASDPPAPQAKLPCLNAIAGVDPFFTPADTTAPALTPPASLGSLLMPPLEPTAALPPKNSTINNTNLDTISNHVLHSPAVEVIGQQAEQMPVVTEKNLAAEAPLHEENPEVELMNESNLEKPIVEIHEYDLAMKVLPNPDATFTAQQASGAGEFVASEPHDNNLEGSDITSYWSQGNVTSFVPGVTPVDAYPVCQEYADQISVSNDTNLATLDDVAAEHASQSDQAILSKDHAENRSDSDVAVAAIPAVAERTVEQMQVDPFANEEFESVRHVTPVSSGNQVSPMTPEKLTAAISPSDVDSAEETKPVAASDADPASYEEPSETAETTNEAVTAEESDLAAEPEANLADEAELTAETYRSAEAPLDVTQAIPRLPNNVTSSTPDSYPLFESVEQSLSDLQSINQLDSEETISQETISQETISPATNAQVDLSDQSPLATAASTEESVTAEEPVRAEEPVSVATPVVTEEPLALPVEEPALDEQPTSVESSDDLLASAMAPLDSRQSAAPAFAPVDLTAQLPAVPTKVDEATSATETVEPQPSAEAEAPAENPAATDPSPKVQVIEVDGNDGYDFLDVKAFDFANATITPGIIFLDDGLNKFQIEYKNLSLAVFAGDFQVELQ